MERSLSHSAGLALKRGTIERQAKSLTRTQLGALRRIRDRGSDAWCDGRRAGGATSRMFDRLEALGLVTSAPYQLTKSGRDVLALRA